MLIEQSIQTEQISAEGKDEGVQVRPLLKVSLPDRAIVFFYLKREEKEIINLRLKTSIIGFKL